LLDATAHNDDASTATELVLGSTTTDTLAATEPHWFRYQVRAGRSYCVETDNAAAAVSMRDTVLAVFQGDGSTPIGSNDDVAGEPSASLLSRVCYIAAATGANLAQVTGGTSGAAGGFRIRAVETTLFAPWFVSGNGYEAFVVLRSTTTGTHTAEVTLQPGGGPGFTRTLSVPANGTRALQVSALPPDGFGVASLSGGVVIAHDGPPGGLTASVTSISFSGGISFDTLAGPRSDLR
jgi:hypothetical protein